MNKESSINPILEELSEDVMGFLNEIQLNYPEAISFASGRPPEDFFDVENFSTYFNLYVDSLVAEGGQQRSQILNSLGQYSRTKGIVNEVVSKYLKNDENIDVSADSIIMTVGTQEALCISVIALCDKFNDVIIIEDPTYVGITYFARLAGYQIEAVPVDDSGISLELLEKRILKLQAEGKRVKLVYVIPDYQNPTGITMPIEKRHQLLILADKYNFYILEDNAYGEFTYNKKKIATLKALDKNKQVIYLRSLSKTIYPSLRLGVLVSDQQVQVKGKYLPLSDLMAQVKGYITVNTSAINQAIFGGILIKNKYSLKNLNRRKINDLKEKLDCLATSLNTYLSSDKYSWAKSISWSVPEGGFFITIKLPFKVDENEIKICASRYGVIITPMSFFYFANGGEYHIRLAFSNVSTENIKIGTKRLSEYLKSKLSL